MSRVRITVSDGCFLAEVPDQFSAAIAEDPGRFRWVWAEQYRAWVARRHLLVPKVQ